MGSLILVPLVLVVLPMSDRLEEIRSRYYNRLTPKDVVSELIEMVDAARAALLQIQELPLDEEIPDDEVALDCQVQAMKFVAAAALSSPETGE